MRRSATAGSSRRIAPAVRTQCRHHVGQRAVGGGVVTLDPRGFASLVGARLPDAVAVEPGVLAAGKFATGVVAGDDAYLCSLYCHQVGAQRLQGHHQRAGEQADAAVHGIDGKGLAIARGHLQLHLARQQADLAQARLDLVVNGAAGGEDDDAAVGQRI